MQINIKSGIIILSYIFYGGKDTFKVLHLSYTQNVSNLAMKKFYVFGRTLAVIGAILGGASVIGYICFAGGWIENGSKLAGWLLLACGVCLALLTFAVTKLPDFLMELEEAALELAEEAKASRQKSRYIRCRKLADAAYALRRGMFQE